MADSKIRDNNFFMVSGWMLNKLNLKGAALQIYAIIYGFSQDGESYFTGSLQYLSDFTNASKPTIIKALKELVENGYLIKVENEMNGVKFNKYKANLLVVKNLNGGSQDSLPGGSKETLLGGSKETLPNKEIKDNKSFIDKEVEEVVNLYHSICVSLPAIRAVSAQRKKAIKARLQTYSMEDFKAMFQKAEASSFLKGKNERNWNATFDWLINEANMAKVLEDNYAYRGRKENLPDWFGKRELDEDERLAVQRMMAPDKELGLSEHLAIQRILEEDTAFDAEAEQLRRELQEAFGG